MKIRKNRVIKFGILMFVLLFFIGCGGEGSTRPKFSSEDTDANTETETGETGTASGAEVKSDTGTDTDMDIPATDWRKQIDLSLSEPNPNYEIGTAIVTLDDVDDQSCYLMIPVKNVSQRTRCFISLRNVVSVSPNGTPHPSDLENEIILLDGTVQQISESAIFDNSCLRPEEIGYFLSHIGSLSLYGFGFDDLAAIRATELSEDIDISDFREPEYRLEMVEGPTYSERLVEVVIENTSSIDLETAFSKYLLLDSNGYPLLWGDLSSDIDDLRGGQLAPGDTMVLVADPDSPYPVSDGRIFLEYQSAEE